MAELPDELLANRSNWDERVPIHLGPNGYDVEGLITDPIKLSCTITHDAAYLGSLEGLDVCHLQCHIGTDTLSLTRLGATCVGLDFSAPAIAAARELATRTNAPMTFVESPVYEACHVLGRGRFDVVYTSCGAVNWLPSIGRWATEVAGLLKPGGRLYFRDSHPILFALDEGRLPDEVVLRYAFSEAAGPMVFDEDDTYSGEGTLTQTRTYEWNHSSSELVQGLIDAGLVVTEMADEDALEWEFYPGQPQRSPGWWCLPPDLATRIPLMLRLQAIKPTAG